MTLEDWFAGRATKQDIASYIPNTCGDVAKLLVQLKMIKPFEKAIEAYTSLDYARLRTRAKYQYAADMIAEKRRRETAR